MSPRREKWSLDKDALSRLLERLDADPVAAARRYEEIRRRLIHVLEWRGSADPDAHADETLDRVARKIQAGVVIENVTGYACGVARYVLQESERKRGRERAAVEELGRREAADSPPDSSDIRNTCLSKCLAALAPTSRALIEAYYQGWERVQLDDRKALAERMGLTATALKMRAFRTRRVLVECLRGCIDGRTHETDDANRSL